jgi:hypothetical protein
MFGIPESSIPAILSMTACAQTWACSNELKSDLRHRIFPVLNIFKHACFLPDIGMKMLTRSSLGGWTTTGPEHRAIKLLHGVPVFGILPSEHFEYSPLRRASPCLSIVVLTLRAHRTPTVSIVAVVNDFNSRSASSSLPSILILNSDIARVYTTVRGREIYLTFERSDKIRADLADDVQEKLLADDSDESQLMISLSW